MTASVFRPLGSGNCTRMPCTAGSRLSFATTRQQIGLRHVGRQLVLERGHAGGLGLGVLGADIDLAGGIVADQNHREARHQIVFALDAGDLVSDASAKFRRDDFSIDDLGRHVSSLGLSIDGSELAQRLAKPCRIALDGDLLQPRRRPGQQTDAGLGHAERFRQQPSTARLASPPSAMARTRTFKHAAAVGQLLDPVDVVAAAARRHPQRDADARGGGAPRDPSRFHWRSTARSDRRTRRDTRSISQARRQAMIGDRSRPPRLGRKPAPDRRRGPAR